jgi:Flp pilus assembly protein TadG
MKSPLAFFRKFGRDETGTLMAEAILVLPFMLWSYLALFVYWDSFRSMNTVQKAAYTVADMLSREMIPINQTTSLNGMDAMMEYMIDGDQEAKMRVTSVKWSAANNRNEVAWSRSPNNAMTALTTATLQPMSVHIPQMADGDYVVFVEVIVDFKPSFNVGMGEQELKQFIVTRPRFVPKICLIGVTCV